MSRPSAASYYSENDADTPSYSTAENTRKASTAESTHSVMGSVFFHTPPASTGATPGGVSMGSMRPSSSSEQQQQQQQQQQQNGHPYASSRPVEGVSGGGRPPRAVAAPSANTASQRAPNDEADSDAFQRYDDAYAPVDAPTQGVPDWSRSREDTAAPASAEATAAADEAAFDELERRARQALESIAVRDDDVELHLDAYIRTLRQYRDVCQTRTLYREAHLVEQVLRNLKVEEETRHIRGLTEQQVMERQQLEDVHREEFRDFHRAWNAKIDEFEENQLEAEIALLERQNDDLLALHEEMRMYIPRALKCDKQTLDARSRQQLLASQRDFRGASKAKAEGDKLEYNQLERAEEERAATYIRREHTLRQHHIQELNALRIKTESRRLLLEKHRKRELDELLQRYINLRRGMDTQHAIVRGKTGTLLLKHAQNPRSNLSGTAAVVESACSGAYGTLIQRRQQEEYSQSSSTTQRMPIGVDAQGQPTHEQSNDLGRGTAVSENDMQADQRRLYGGSRRA